jgi:hypothetical protein
MIKLRDNDFYFTMEKLLYNKLNMGAIKRDLVDVSYLRSASKTYTLVKFAKENDLDVVMGFTSIAHKKREDLNYERIYGVDELEGMPRKSVVIDEGIPSSKLKTIKENGHNLVTGYYCS